MTVTHPARTLTGRLRAAGAAIAIIGLTLATIPLTASAAEPALRTITVEVQITDGEDTAVLPGTTVVLRAEPSGEEAGRVRTGRNGRVAFDIDPEASEQYSAHALWPNEDTAVLDSSREFRSADAEVVTVTMSGEFRFVSGRITASAGGTALPDLTGGTVVVAYGGVAVQELPLAADGTFAAQALPADPTAAYQLTFTPPAGYALVAGAANPPFALPADPDGAGATRVDVSREFSVVSTAVPTPVPTPEPEPTASTGTPVVVSGATDMGAAMNDISEAELEALLDAVAQAGPGSIVPVTNASGQVLGVVTAPQPPAEESLLGMVGSMNTALPAVSPQAVPVVSMDLDALLKDVQATRQTLLEAQMAGLIQDIATRNTRITRLNEVLVALSRWVEDGSWARHAAVMAAFDAAGIQPLVFADLSFVSMDPAQWANTSPRTIRYHAIQGAVVQVKEALDSTANSQQMDMLRLQSLSQSTGGAVDTLAETLKRMQNSQTSVTGSMRSEPVAIGTVRWNSGAVAGGFNLSAVPGGAHHLILTFAGAGVTIIADVDVRRQGLANSGVEARPTAALGVGMLLLGIVAVIGAQALRRGRLPRQID